MGYNIVMATKMGFLDNEGANELSRLLTSERLKRAGLSTLSESRSADPDVEAMRRVVRSSKVRNSGKRLPVTSGQILKKLGAWTSH